MIEFRLYYNGSKSKSQHVFIDGGSALPCTNVEALEIIREHPDTDFRFLDWNNQKRDVTCERLLASLKTIELNKCSNDVELLNRIIRNGGFVEYLTRMENAREQTNP